MQNRANITPAPQYGMSFLNPNMPVPPAVNPGPVGGTPTTILAAAAGALASLSGPSIPSGSQTLSTIIVASAVS